VLIQRASRRPETYYAPDRLSINSQRPITFPRVWPDNDHLPWIGWMNMRTKPRGLLTLLFILMLGALLDVPGMNLITEGIFSSSSIAVVVSIRSYSVPTLVGGDQDEWRLRSPSQSAKSAERWNTSLCLSFDSKARRFWWFSLECQNHNWPKASLFYDWQILWNYSA